MSSVELPCLFCQIVAGEKPSWVVQEDWCHLAFLTPFPNTPGVTVVVPKAHAGDYLFGLHGADYVRLLEFSRRVVAAMEVGLNASRVAMVVEGTGVPHVHVKLYPLHGELAKRTDVWSPLQVFSKEYLGWLTTHEGPRMPDADLERIRNCIRDAGPSSRRDAASAVLPSKGLAPPNTWRVPDEHLRIALSQPWFRHVAQLQDAIHLMSTRFFNRRGLQYLMLPLTTRSISSPVSPASDSLPVRVQLFGQDVYLADSMQFLLEYGVRLCDAGVWYHTLSFRGEEPDARHLTEFSHIEAEIPGGLDDVLRLVEDLVRELAVGILELSAESVKALAGSAAHVEQLASITSFPRLRHVEAVELLSGQAEFLTERGGATVLTPCGEAALLEKFGPAVWVTHHPPSAVPFYQRRVQGREEVVLSADLLLTGPGEVVGAGERHYSPGELTKAIAAQGLSTDEYAWYVEMKRMRPLATGGFGLGVERFLQWLTRATDIRNMQLVIRQRGLHGSP